MRVEVVYALPERQWLVQLDCPAGTHAAQAVTQACEQDKLPPQAQTPPLALSLFSKRIDADHPLNDGDRVEVLRPLKADPKEVRRALAAVGQTMGKKRGT